MHSVSETLCNLSYIRLPLGLSDGSRFASICKAVITSGINKINAGKYL